MEARRTHTARAVVGLWGLVILLANGAAPAASYRTQNFIVSAADPGFAKQVGDSAEVYRRDLAIQWLGQELPPWSQPCPITVDVGPHLGAGGATSFAFAGNSGPVDWRMEIQGSSERILDSVLPHEITHTIFATYFRRPLPRWADEGACTTVECDSERANHQRMLLRYLTAVPSRGIAFNRMVEMTEYPRDIMPLYAQSHSVVQYLLYHGGKQKFVAFVGDGMRTNNWNMAINQHYGFEDLSELQLKWVAWVRDGSPALVAQQPADGAPDTRAAVATTPAPSDEQLVVRGQAPAKSGLLDILGVGDSWYARQRDAQPAATAQAATGDPHQGPTSDTQLSPLPTPSPQPTLPPAAAQPLPQPTPRAPDQRPKPFDTAGNNNSWQPAGTAAMPTTAQAPAASVVRKAIPQRELDVAQPQERILFDAPVGRHATIWR